jgi:hypothetical protein
MMRMKGIAEERRIDILNFTFNLAIPWNAGRRMWTWVVVVIVINERLHFLLLRDCVVELPTVFRDPGIIHVTHTLG